MVMAERILFLIFLICLWIAWVSGSDRAAVSSYNRIECVQYPPTWHYNLRWDPLYTEVQGTWLSDMKSGCPWPQPMGKFRFKSTPIQSPLTVRLLIGLNLELYLPSSSQCVFSFSVRFIVARGRRFFLCILNKSGNIPSNSISMKSPPSYLLQPNLSCEI